MRYRGRARHAVLIEVERRLPSSAEPGQGLSPQLRVWLDEFDRAYADSFATNTYPPEIRQRLIYVLDVDSDRNGSPGPSRKPPNPHFEVRRINSATSRLSSLHSIADRAVPRADVTKAISCAHKTSARPSVPRKQVWTRRAGRSSHGSMRTRQRRRKHNAALPPN